MTRPTLLCADDDTAVRELYRILLDSYGYDVIVAEDGYHALKLFHANNVSAVILDYEMPGLRGSEVAAEIKRHNPDTPVLIVSGCQSVVEDAPRFVDAALAKGAPIARLLDKIETLLNVARSQARRPSFAREFVPLGSALATVVMAAALISRVWK